MNRAWTAQYDAGVSPNFSYPDIVLSSLLTRTASLYPDRPALRFYGRTISYRELEGFVNQFAHALMSMGIGTGKTVGIMLPNLPQTVIGFFGSLRTGAVVTMINPLYVESEIRHQITDAGCDTLVVFKQFYPRVAPLLDRGTLKRVIVTGVEDFLPWWKRLLYPIKTRREGTHVPMPRHPAVVTFRDLLSGPITVPPVSTAPDDVALLQYTGGTTGIPKGVVLTHRNLVANTWQCRQWVPMLREGQEIFLGVLPFFHVYGMSVCQNLAIATGSALVLLPRFQVGEVLDTIVREQVTVFPGIPAMYTAINGHQRLDRYNLHTIRVCISGAGALHPSVQEKFESLTGAKLVEGYGLTEASPVTHVNPTEQPVKARRRGSIGLPLPGTDARIMDSETGREELPVGHIGELVIRGPQIMREYWKRDDETKQVLRDGWLYTGDMARRDEAGYFYIEDRKKDMIKSGGENVYPREVEEVILRHPKVKDAVVVGIPQELRGELIKAYVVLKDHEQAVPGEILEHCRKELAKFKVPKKVEFRAELPKTLVGKVLRRVLLEEELKKHGTSAQAKRET